jgi:hypothetical protein
MKDRILQIYTEWKIKYTLLRDLSPTHPEIQKAHAAFLVELHKQFPTLHKSRFGLMQYAFAIVAGIIILNGGAIIYADTTDVPTSHPLYSYKLLAEEVRVKTASVETQPEVEVKIAERRVKELGELPKPSASVQKTQKQLRQNFKLRIESVQLNLDKESLSKNSRKKAIVCKELSSINDHLSDIFDDEHDSQSIREKIAHICAIEQNKTRGRDKTRD